MPKSKIVNGRCARCSNVTKGPSCATCAPPDQTVEEIVAEGEAELSDLATDENPQYVAKDSAEEE